VNPTPAPDTPTLRAERVPLDDPRWLALLDRSEAVTPSHLPAWTKIVADSYGFPSFALVLLRENEAVAGLPIVDVSTRLRGRRYSALPFTDECGPVAGPDDLSALVHALCALRRQEQLIRIEVRACVPAVEADVVSYVRGVRHHLQLEPTVEQAFAKLSSHHRRAVRTAQRSQVHIEIGASAELLATFAALHASTRKRLGVPVQPRRFLSAIGSALVEHEIGYIAVAWQGDRPVAAGVFLEANGVALYKFGASDARAWSLRANNLLVWEAIRHAIEHGATLFDFGRSDLGQDGLSSFKRNFGATETPLVYTSIGLPEKESRLKPGRISGRIIQLSPPLVARAAGRLLYRYTA
jgi:CelD/BcsL family acetyltransferase involved in cellulose biosynthesis